MNTSRAGTVFYWIGLLSGSIGLVIQLPMTVTTQMGLGRSFPDAVIYFFSFFTNWTNILLVLIYLALTTFAANRLRWFRSPVIKATGFAAIIMVMMVYHILLSADHNPTGIDAFTNILLHYVTPPAFVLWWAFAGRDSTLRWADLGKFTLFPVIYVVYAYVRAAITGEYPYNFLNIETNGIGGVAPVIGAIVILILLLGIIAIFIDRKFAKSA